MAVTVEITRSTVLKPSPERPVAPRTAVMVPLTIFDYASTDDYIPIVLAWDAPAPSNGALKDGLLATVARFPHLAGRFAVDGNHNKCIHLNAAGVLVLEATDSAHLADVLRHANINHLYPNADKNNGEDEPLFQVQLTRYSCGGLVIGGVSHHQVADGQSMSVFYTAWATAVRTGSAILPSPFLDRAGTAVPRSMPMPAFDHRNIEFKGQQQHRYGEIPLDMISYFTVHFPEEFVADLKAHVGERCSTFQCLLAHVWKKVTAARDIEPDDQFTQVRVAVNCRGRSSKVPVPMDFFGNMVLWAFPKMQVKDLISATYAEVVAAIRDAVARVDDEYIQSFVDFGGNGGGVDLKSTAGTPGMVFCPDLEVDSWLGFRFHGLDFGGGPPCAFLAPDLPIDGLMVLVPSCSAKGGVDLFIALEKNHVDTFKNICYSMD